MSHQDWLDNLKKQAAETRLPTDVREQILAELPDAQEREELYRQMMSQGGYSFQQLWESLNLPEETRS